MIRAWGVQVAKPFPTYESRRAQKHNGAWSSPLIEMERMAISANPFLGRQQWRRLNRFSLDGAVNPDAVGEGEFPLEFQPFPRMLRISKTFLF